MARYHLGKDGPMKCSAQIQCPLQKKAIENGEDPNQIFHYNNKAAAVEAYQAKMDATHDVHGSGKLSKKKVSKMERQQSTYTTVIDPTVTDFESSQKLYTGRKISGHIDPSALNDESYKDFGFDEWTDERVEEAFGKNVEESRRIYDANGKFVEMLSQKVSEKEMKDLTEEQKAILQAYTYTSYDWINSALFNEQVFDNLPSKESATTKSFFTRNFRGDKNDIKQRYILPKANSHKSVELMDRMVKSLDSSLHSGPKKQRVVYRGASSDYEFRIGDDEMSSAEWIAKNRRLGNVVKYDGYASTSYNLDTLKVFSHVSEFTEGKMASSKIIYEILTPEGMSLQSISMFRYEEEVLLPREQQYMVVGNQKCHHSSKDGDVTVHVVQMVAVDKDNNILDGTNSTMPRPLEYWE